MPFYKSLTSLGESAFGKAAVFVDSLPVGDEPGPWVEVAGEISVNPDAPNEDRGIFLCRDERELLRWLGEFVYEAEPDVESQFIQDHGYTVAKRVRLVRRLFEETWTDEAARRFAADCAEHVLHLFPNGEQKDELRNVLNGAREQSTALDDPEANDALEDLANLAEAIYAEIGGVSPAAARAAHSVAEAAHGYRPGAEAARNAATAARSAAGDQHDAELEWQVNRLMTILQPPPFNA